MRGCVVHRLEGTDFAFNSYNFLRCIYFLLDDAGFVSHPFRALISWCGERVKLRHLLPGPPVARTRERVKSTRVFTRVLLVPLDWLVKKAARRSIAFSGESDEYADDESQLRSCRF